MPARRSARWWMGPVALLLLAAGSCTATDTAATPEGRAATSPADANEGDPRLRACVEAAGYDWDAAWPPWTSEEPPPEDSLYADPAFHAVLEGCLVETGAAAEGPFDEERIARENAVVLEYVRCMRARGWELPEPEVWEGPEHPGLLEQPPVPVPEGAAEAEQAARDSLECGFPLRRDVDGASP